MGRRLGSNHLKLQDLLQALECLVGMLEHRLHLSLRLRRDSGHRVEKMPVCEAHRVHHKISLVKGRLSRQLGPNICNKDDLATRLLCRDQNQARNE